MPPEEGRPKRQRVFRYREPEEGLFLHCPRKIVAWLLCTLKLSKLSAAWMLPEVLRRRVSSFFMSSPRTKTIIWKVPLPRPTACPECTPPGSGKLSYYDVTPDCVGKYGYKQSDVGRNFYPGSGFSGEPYPDLLGWPYHLQELPGLFHVNCFADPCDDCGGSGRNYETLTKMTLDLAKSKTRAELEVMAKSHGFPSHGRGNPGRHWYKTKLCLAEAIVKLLY